MAESPPLIFDIHRFVLDDGPGIRTTVFFKGCPLACVWCHNPEAMSSERELACYPELCVRCGACAAACPHAAISMTPIPRLDRTRCTVCGACAATCPAMALRMKGQPHTLHELLELILRDRHFFAASGGGVTFSGGEPTLPMAYLSDALRALKVEGLHTAIQTCGMFDYDEFARHILPFVDLIMFDLKLIDAGEHRRFTGRDNAQILANFRRLAGEAGARMLPRVPLIPGITATVSNLLGIASFLAETGCRRCDLLSHNPAGAEKRRAIGMSPVPGLPEQPLSAAEEAKLRRLFFERLAQCGI